MPELCRRSTCAILMLLLTAVAPPTGAAAAPGRTSVAVLPFQQDTPREEDKYLSAGFAETLTNALARVGDLQVIERGQIKRVLEELKLQSSGLVDPEKAAQVGKQVGAKQVVVGSFMRAGTAMRVTCRFVDVETAAVDPKHTATVTRPLAKDEELFDLLDQVAAEVVKGFGVEATAEVKEKLEQVVHQTNDARAFEYYTQAREKMLLATRAGMAEAIPLFEKAVAEDKEYALAWAGLSLALNGLGLAKYENGEDGQADFRRSLDAAKKAAQIKPDLSDAHIALAMAYGPRVEGAGSDDERKRKREEAARKAVQLDDRSALAHYNLWAALDGPLEGEGFRHIEKAIELDPRLPVARANLGLRYNAVQRFAEAVPHFKAVIEANPKATAAWNNLGMAYAGMGNLDEALRAYDKGIAIEPRNAVLYNNKGDALFAAQRFIEAVLAYQKAIEVSPNHPMAHFKVAQIQQATGNLMGAAASAKRFVDLAKDKPEYAALVTQARAFLAMMGMPQ